MAETETMTVAQLIEALRLCPPGAKVFTAGCDCDGEAWSIQIRRDEEVLIERNGDYRPFCSVHKEGE